MSKKVKDKIQIDVGAEIRLFCDMHPEGSEVFGCKIDRYVMNDKRELFVVLPLKEVVKAWTIEDIKEKNV